jgi:two-component system, OmpR family, sensor histidine kinase SenX3
MERFLDLRRTAIPDTATQDDPLVACYQTFLGHDLPGQLVALQALARLLEADTESVSPEARELLGRIASLTRRLDTLTRRIAALGQVSREPAYGPPVRVSDLVEEAVAEVGVGGLRIEYSISGNLSQLLVSRRLFHRALVQLLRNAAQAALTTQPPRVEVQCHDKPVDFPEWSVAVRICDNGRGINTESAQRLFVPLAPAIGSAPDGTARDGLGLALVQQIVAHWGGAIHVHSRPMNGTTFTLLLPPAALPQT